MRRKNLLLTLAAVATVVLMALLMAGCGETSEEPEPTTEAAQSTHAVSGLVEDLSNGNPERGWGMMFPNFIEGMDVVNYAQNGRSTKSFIDRGLWDQVKANLKPGDWVFIEFGHNDSKEKDPARYCAPFGAYQDNLRRFIADSKCCCIRYHCSNSKPEYKCGC